MRIAFNDIFKSVDPTDRRILCQNNNSKPAHVLTNSPVSFLSLMNNGQPVEKKVIYFKNAFSLKSYRFWRCNFVTVYTFLWEFPCIKKSGDRTFLQNESDLAILNIPFSNMCEEFTWPDYQRRNIPIWCLFQHSPTIIQWQEVNG